MKSVGFNGEDCALVIVEDTLRQGRAYPMIYKDDPIPTFDKYCTKVLKRYPKTVYLDRDGKFVKTELTDYLTSKGIEYIYVPPNAHGLLGKAERHIGWINQLSRCTLYRHKAPPYCWPWTYKTLNYVIDRIPRAVLSFQSTLSRKQQKLIDCSDLLTWGSKVYYKNSAQHPKDHDPRTLVAYFLYFDPDGNFGSYICLNPDTMREISVSLFLIDSIDEDSNVATFLTDADHSNELVNDLPSTLPKHEADSDYEEDDQEDNSDEDSADREDNSDEQETSQQVTRPQRTRQPTKHYNPEEEAMKSMQ